MGKKSRAEEIRETSDKILREGLTISVVGWITAMVSIWILYGIIGNTPLLVLAIVPQAIIYIIGLPRNSRKLKRELKKILERKENESHQR